MLSKLKLQLHDQLVSMRLHVVVWREYVIKAGMVHRLDSRPGTTRAT
jgi:hypothetical protein